jgi:replication fork clamp-binding protein CrfC
LPDEEREVGGRSSLIEWCPKLARVIFVGAAVSQGRQKVSSATDVGLDRGRGVTAAEAAW